MIPFADALADACRKTGPIGLGLDPHLHRLPMPLQQRFVGKTGAEFREAAAEAVVDFNRLMIGVARGHVAALKPQFAFYEQLGGAGFAALEETCKMARDAGLLLIADAKRGDISSTAAAYARSIVDPNGPMACDSVTLNPWMGTDVLLPFLEYCHSAGRGMFVLVRTTNPGSALLQCHHGAAQHLAQQLHRLAADRGLISEQGWSPIGAVVGAQRHEDAANIRRCMPAAWFLVPGVGAQGGGVADALAGARPDGTGSLVVSSRGLLYPSEPAESLDAAAAFTRRQIETLAAALRGATG